MQKNWSPKILNSFKKLSELDDDLKYIINKYNLPDSRKESNTFETLMRIIIGQQISRKAAESIYQKLKEREEELNLIETISYKDTNMIFLSFEDMTVSSNFIKKLEDQNIRSGFIRKNIVRLVIHKDIKKEDLDKIVDSIVHSSSA